MGPAGTGNVLSTVRRRRINHIISAVLLAVALACLWIAWTASQGIQGAYFTEDLSEPSRVGHIHDPGTTITTTVVLWVVAAVVSAATAFAVSRPARRR
jgi:hypothetical protein